VSALRQGSRSQGITAAAVHYRGSGWAKKERRTAAASKTGGDGASGDGGKDEGGKGDTSKDGPAEGPAPATAAGSAKGKSGKAADKTAAPTGD